MDCFFCPLDSEALLHITGPDALDFLQGQTTCDTRAVSAAQAVPGAYCTPQGRVVCDFLLVQLGPEHYAMRMRRDIVAHSAEVFGKYIVFSKAELDTGRADWQVFGLWGAAAGSLLAGLGLEFDATNAGQYAGASANGLLAVQLDAAGQQFECYLQPDASAAALQALRTGAGQGTEPAWRGVQLQSAVPRVEQAIVDTFVPQTLNYDLTGHISFNKGCYTGQEVVARLHYRGKPKRRTYLARLPAGAEAGIGDPLFSDAGNCGDIVNLAQADSGTMALVSATEQGVDNGLHLASGTGPELQLLPMPYSLAPE